MNLHVIMSLSFSEGRRPENIRPPDKSGHTFTHNILGPFFSCPPGISIQGTITIIPQIVKLSWLALPDDIHLISSSLHISMAN